LETICDKLQVGEDVEVHVRSRGEI